MLVDLLVASAANHRSVLGCYVVTSLSQPVLVLPSLCKSPSEIDADSAVYGRTEAFYFASGTFAHWQIGLAYATTSPVRTS